MNSKSWWAGGFGLSSWFTSGFANPAVIESELEAKKGDTENTVNKALCLAVRSSLLVRKYSQSA